MNTKFNLCNNLIVFFTIAFLLSGAWSPNALQAQEDIDLSQLKYRHIGPQGNRMIAVVGEPGNNNIYYAGAASGGLWKSNDGGINWHPIFDDMPAQSVSALAIAPSDTNVIWAGTGETFIRSNVSIGNGIYRSTDAGKTWKNMGLEKSGRIARIIIDPRNPKIVFAAATGHLYGPQPERGVFRTKNGGETWEKVLFVDENTGCSEIAMDPNNPRILFSGMWQIVIKTWGRSSGGPGSGVFRSKDGGSTWKRLKGHGLPASPVGKIAVAVAPSDSNRVYALIETGNRGSLWQSDDGGENWRVVSYNRLLNERPHYYTRMVISPDDCNEVYFPSNSMSVTFDGGETSKLIRWGGDNHDMWVDPLNADRMMIANDQGVMISTNHGRGWNRVVLPVAQMYHVSVDNRVPYYVYGNRQDGNAYRGPSNSLTRGWGGGGISSGMWQYIGGCECGFAYTDPSDDNIVWGGCYNAGLDVFDIRNRQKRSVRVWPESPMGAPAGLLKYRFNWTFPIAVSPHDNNKVYAGSQHVHMTKNRGQSWEVISPDLSLNDSEMLGDSGGLTRDNLGVEYGCIVFAIAESPVEEGVIWAGTNDGLVHVTRDEGKNWKNVTKNIPRLPSLGTVSNIEPSKYDAGTCYISVDLHQVNNRDPFIYKTTDYGKSWKSISSNIPRTVFSYVHCVREDPRRKGLLYAGTENSVFVSFDDGAKWLPLQTNLPHAPVHWLTIQPNFNDLVIATYGRGFWIMDDITPIQQLTDEALSSDAYFFAPRHAYRFVNRQGIQSCPNDQVTGQNPPFGASLNYYLKTKARKGMVTIYIKDSKGQIVRKLIGPGKAGVNRLWWDLKYEPPKQARLRLKPAGNVHVWDEKRFKRYTSQGWMPLISWGIGSGLSGPMVVPGNYTVKLLVDGKEYIQNVEVKKDPSSSGSLPDIKDQVDRALEIKSNIDTVVDSINRIEWIRNQLTSLIEVLKLDKNKASLVTAAGELDKKFIKVEDYYFQRILAEGDLKSFRAPNKLYSKLAILAGDVGDSADFPPTDQEIEVHELLKKKLAKAEKELADLLEKDMPAFNTLLRENNIENVIK